MTWTLLHPPQPQHTFTDTKSIGIPVNLTDGVSVVLTRANETFSESIISLTVLRNNSWNGTELECSINSALTTTLNIEVTNEFGKSIYPGL